jgi:hypothetical protein
MPSSYPTFLEVVEFPQEPSTWVANLRFAQLWQEFRRWIDHPGQIFHMKGNLALKVIGWEIKRLDFRPRGMKNQNIAQDDHQDHQLEKDEAIDQPMSKVINHLHSLTGRGKAFC